MTHPAEHYVGGGLQGTVPAGLRPLHAACQEVLKRQGLALRWDERLQAAAQTLASVRQVQRLNAAALTFVLRSHGVVEPHARLIAKTLPGRGPLTAQRSLFAHLVSALATGPFNRLGATLATRPDGRRRLVAVLLRSHVTTEPVPRAPGSDSSVLLRGRIAAGYAQPQVVVTHPTGQTHHPRLVAATDDTFHAVVPLRSHAGVYQVEILATGPRGPEVLANFPLYSGVPLPTSFALRQRAVPPATARRPSTFAPRAARRLMRWINEARRRAGRAELRWDRKLAKIAARHSQEMCQHGEVGHHSPITGTATDRVRHAGVRAVWVGENVGQAATLAEAHREFMASPAHRATRLRPGLTHLGIGVCLARPSAGGAPAVFVTELYITRAAKPPR